MTEQELHDKWSAIEVLVMYWYNTDPGIIMRGLFPGTVEHYIEEKVGLYRHGLVAFWGMLDFEHQTRLIGLAEQKYNEEVAKRLEARKEA